ncbi:hypothetical protein RN001_001339 [Aquatica leii]|uniref:Carboxylesterase type B domain-containing protein n=1 Tax=Aquatica leii TaxID=1421715 RepID=A0AAN7PG76_9COLE|nr:hypothetical protein RN001_001339 [Aquatica leii]
MADPVVTVKNGKLRGKTAKNYDGEEYYSFQGIPYAKPPIGSLRFKPPVPSQSWEGIRDATKEENDCIFYDVVLKKISGSEDCLYLNVYTKQLPVKNKALKPVMFWIHGGGFKLGSGSSILHGPDFLLTKDIVLVTINYRTGLLGFLNFEDSSLEVPGNMGLKDQLLALKWVRENISQFNGDINNVTIFGGSSGAVSVHYLLLSPLAKDLFHKCIMQSGCISSWWANGHRSLPYLIKVLKKDVSEKDVLSILNDMTASEVVNLQTKFSDVCEPWFKRCIGPVIEYKSTSAILTEDPDLILRSGNYNQVPMIIGFTSREGMVFDVYAIGNTECTHSVQDFESVIPHTIRPSMKNEYVRVTADKIKKFYYGDQESTEDNKNQFYLLHGDVSVVWPIYRTIKQHNSVSKTPIYLYRMSFESTLNFIKKMLKIDTPGVAHGDELSYFFKNIFIPEIIPNSIEEKIIKTCVNLWTNFAIYGNPNSPHKDSLINVYWKPTERNNLHYLDIGENITTGINPDENRINFWDEL